MRRLRLLAALMLCLQGASCVPAVSPSEARPRIEVTPVAASGDEAWPGPPHRRPAPQLAAFEAPSVPGTPPDAPVPGVRAAHVATAVVFALAITLALLWFSGDSDGTGRSGCPPIC